jgi:hypothetical protein
MPTIHVRVTQDHIGRGSRATNNCCPIALALKDAGIAWVRVGSNTIRLLLRDMTFLVNLPATAKQFVWAFDRGEPVRPTYFELYLPSVGYP